MTHICVSESGQPWFRWWLVVYSTPSHYLNHCLRIVNWTLRRKLQWNFNQIQKFSFTKMHLKICSLHVFHSDLFLKNYPFHRISWLALGRKRLFQYRLSLRLITAKWNIRDKAMNIIHNCYFVISSTRKHSDRGQVIIFYYVFCMISTVKPLV